MSASEITKSAQGAVMAGVKMLVENGVSIEDAKHQAISLFIKGAVAHGIPVDAAWDAVFGEGEYEKFAHSVWTQLNAKNTAAA